MRDASRTRGRSTVRTRRVARPVVLLFLAAGFGTFAFAGRFVRLERRLALRSLVYVLCVFVSLSTNDDNSGRGLTRHTVARTARKQVHVEKNRKKMYAGRA